MLLTGEAVSILFGTLFAGAESTLVQVELDRMWLACQKRSESFRDSSTTGWLPIRFGLRPTQKEIASPHPRTPSTPLARCGAQLAMGIPHAPWGQHAMGEFGE